MAQSWYIINAASGQEKKVAQMIKEQAAEKDMTDQISEVLVPSEETVEVRRGKKVASEKKFFPGYVLVKMEMNEHSWHLIKGVPKVSGFLGGKGKPQAISDAEAERILEQVREGVKRTEEGAVFEIGEKVKVIDGPFESFVGVVQDVEAAKNKIKVEVSIFGQATPVELEYNQVQKLA
ncbi:MAG: transcription termination/antitermination protein NusG [Alphaproteobacteria bacterium CG11_big_fil_rev_8_21_14_0_20_44_7]|nr:MAG: transcription termination/antitermination protein NusG [Alphaproteobacteria bacterium CG11_big_fil_rev_8_21_14_0_20_44_7]